MFPSRYRSTLLAIIVILAAISLLARWYVLESREYTIYVDNQRLYAKGQYSTIAEVVKSAGVNIRPEDIIQPDRDQIPDPDQPISVVRAQEVILSFEGVTFDSVGTRDNGQRIWSQQGRLASFLAESGTVIEPGDLIYAGDSIVSAEELDNFPLPDRVNIVRQKEIAVREDNQETTLVTSARTIGEALLETGIRLSTGDVISPPLRSWLSPGTVIEIRRSIPITVKIDRQVIVAHTLHRKVSSVIQELGISLGEQDYTIPDETAILVPQDQIEVIRIREELEFSEQIIPFDSVTQLTNELEIDQVAVIQQGVPGILRRSSLVQSENGIEIGRTPAGESVAQEPIDEVIGYGTNIVIRTVDTPDGPLEYWRVVRMRVTAYTAATSGKEPDHPAYGITASGVRAGYGVVAVDPTVVPFRSYVYVPGYGKGFAGDTGGGVKGRFIDLGFDDGKIETWNGYVDVYFLTPVPPIDQINFALPTSLP